MHMLLSLALFTLVAAQPPMPPPGVAPQCATALTEMHRTMYQSWEQWKVHVRQQYPESCHVGTTVSLTPSLPYASYWCNVN